MSTGVYAPSKPPRTPSKAILLAEKITRASIHTKDWVHRKNLLEACRCMYKWARKMGIPAHVPLMGALFYIENRYTENVSRAGARYFVQINPRWQWVFEREVWKTGTTLKKYDICDQAALGVGAYKVMLKTAGGDPLEAVRRYNHSTHPYSYKHQIKVLKFYNQMERE